VSCCPSACWGCLLSCAGCPAGAAYPHLPGTGALPCRHFQLRCNYVRVSRVTVRFMATGVFAGTLPSDTFAIPVRGFLCGIGPLEPVLPAGILAVVVIRRASMVASAVLLLVSLLLKAGGSIMPMALCPYAMLATRGCCCCCCNCMTCCCRISECLRAAPDLVLLGGMVAQNCIGSCWSTVRMRCWQKLVIASASASTRWVSHPCSLEAFKLLGRVRDAAYVLNELCICHGADSIWRTAGVLLAAWCDTCLLSWRSPC
jgi:hypothetical protein